MFASVISACNEGNNGKSQPSSRQVNPLATASDTDLEMHRDYYTSDENYEKAFKHKFGSENGLLDGMVPGTGWSSDAEHIAPNICFNTSQVIHDGAMAMLRSEYLLDYTKLTDFLNVSSSIKGGWGDFGVNATMNYINETNSNNLAVSYNFVEKISRKVNIKYSLSKNKLLNEDGADAYDDGKNPKFRLFCGDRLISSYSEGAFIIVNTQVVLDDKFQKQQFDANIGGNFAGFTELSAKIGTLSKSYKLQGKVIISAFQLGGDPSQLSRVMPSTMTCEFDNLAKCNDLYSTGLASYLKDYLPAQFTKDSAYTPIGDVQLSPILLDDDYDMTMAPSYITNDVKLARNDLINLANKNRANYQAVSAVLNNYPITLDVNFRNQVVNAQNIAHDNLTKLQAATDCWSAPNRCIKIHDAIKPTIIEQPNKNLITGFQDGAKFDSNLSYGPFKAYFYPNKANDATLYLQAATDKSGFYYPTSGYGYFGAANMFQGLAFETHQPRESRYLFYISNNAWNIQWQNATEAKRTFQANGGVIPVSIYNFTLN